MVLLQPGQLLLENNLFGGATAVEKADPATRRGVGQMGAHHAHHGRDAAAGRDEHELTGDLRRRVEGAGGPAHREPVPGTQRPMGVRGEDPALHPLDGDFQAGTAGYGGRRVRAPYRTPVDVRDQGEELPGTKVEGLALPIRVLEDDRPGTGCLLPYPADAHGPQRPLLRCRLVVTAGGRPDTVVAFLAQPGDVGAVHGLPHQPTQPRKGGDGLDQPCVPTSRLGGVGGQVGAAQGHHVRCPTPAGPAVRRPQPCAGHGVVAAQLGVLDVDEQREMRWHPAQRHRFQQRGIVGDRRTSAQVQHAAAAGNERGERNPVVLEQVVQGVGAFVALAVGEHQSLVVQDAGHRLTFPAGAGVTAVAGVPGGQGEKR